MELTKENIQQAIEYVDEQSVFLTEDAQDFLKEFLEAVKEHFDKFDQT